MTVAIGLTGSIGMGKTTTARLFAAEGCAVWDADEAVHRLYSPQGAGVAAIAEAYPDAIENGAVSRTRLKEIIAADPAALKRIERIIHPLVARDRHDFVARARHEGVEFLVLDIPLLFETGADRQMDATVVVSVPPDIQRTRVLERGTMTEAQLDAILRNQMPDMEKRARADYVVETDTTDHARAQVRDILEDLRRRHADA